LNGPVFVRMMGVVRPSERYAPDMDDYHERARTGPCFVCGIVARDSDFSDTRIVYEDYDAIAFFDRWPTQRGYTLVAPKEHREQATGDSTVDEYLALQRIVYGVAEAVREEVGAHWHVVSLHPGTPYEEQQFAAVMLETASAPDMPEDEKVSLAARIGSRMEA
jgi:hypothetical protein